MISDAQLQVGQVLAERYWLQERLGRGAVGDVFRARHVRVPREFAIKVLHPHLVADEKTRARFAREAELAGRLRHRNVIAVLDVGATARTTFLVMDLAHGPTLASLIHARPMAAPRVLDLARQICDGLHHAHEQGLVHRDLKPENVIVETVNGHEVPRIVDFGLAILHEGDPEERERLTTAGIVVGTPHYLAPETARGRPFDRRADLFALGVILYEMLTGVLPFDGEGVEVALANIAAPTPAMRARAPAVEVDPLLEAITRRLLAKAPEDRPATAHEVRELLDLIESDRAAATARLGLAPAPSAPLPAAAPAEPARVAPPEPDLSTRELVVLSGAGRGRAIGLGLLLVALAVLGLGALLRGGSAPRAPVALPPPPPPPVAAAAAERAPPPPPPPPPVVATVEPAPVLVADPPRRPRRDRAPAAPPAPPAAPRVAHVSTDELVALYAAVGRELKAASERRRDRDADDLWQRYRRLRIHDVLASEPRRAEAKALLDDIHRELARRLR